MGITVPVTKEAAGEINYRVAPSKLVTPTLKQRILDEFTANTGYHRKYAIRVLKHGYKCRLRKPKGRQAIYRGEVVEAPEQICSKLLHP